MGIAFGAVLVLIFVVLCVRPGRRERRAARSKQALRAGLIRAGPVRAKDRHEEQAKREIETWRVGDE